MISPEDRLLTLEEAARHCGLDPLSFLDKVRRGQMPEPSGTLWRRRVLDLFLGGILDSEPTVRPGEVYVVGFAGYVKIGWSAAADVRIRRVQDGVPERLTHYATIRGTVLDEGYLHQKFAAHRTRGEWFRNEGELATWIEAGCPL
jgi:hypothetical protein